jgi:hypothetical protein
MHVTEAILAKELVLGPRALFPSLLLLTNGFAFLDERH